MLIHRNFTLFAVGGFLSAVGTAMVPVALSFALLQRGSSASVLGVVLAAQVLPNMVLLLLGGVAGDRWPRRRIMIAADLLCLLAQSTLAALLLRGGAPLSAIFVLVALIGCGGAFFHPAREGLTPELVEPAFLARANGVLSASGSLAAVVGPAVAGLIVAGVGPGWAIGVDALSYAASAFCLALLRPTVAPATRPASAERRSIGRDLRQGLSAFAERRWLWLVVGQFGLLNLLAFAPVLVLAPVILAREPHGAQAWGLLLSACGAGGLAGALAVMRWPPRRTGLAIQGAVLLLAAPLVLLAVHAPLPALLLGGLAYGAGEAIVNVLISTTVQHRLPPELLSRVFSIVQIGAAVLTPAGYALAGPAAGLLGVHLALLAGAGVCVASAAFLLAFPDVRRLNGTPAG